MGPHVVNSFEPHRGKRHRWPHHWADIDPERRALVLTWMAFTATFIIARIITGVIKIASGSTGNVNSGSLHLHHFLWGILLVSAVGVLGLTDRSQRARTRMGIALGIGLGLIVDEVALLVTLKDVYWKSDGWTSVGAAIVVISVAGTALVVTRSGKYEESDPAS
jgi:hypothetical protein